MKQFTLYPIGFVRTLEDQSVLEVLVEFEPLLQGIDAFSHIQVLFWPHRIPDEKRKLKQVHPRGRKEIPKQGIFATRSPARPNPVLVTTVRLLKREQTRLYVQGLDCFDQTPVIDIKPMTRPDETPEDFRIPDWVRKLDSD